MKPFVFYVSKNQHSSERDRERESVCVCVCEIKDPGQPTCVMRAHETKAHHPGSLQTIVLPSQRPPKRRRSGFWVSAGLGTSDLCFQQNFHKMTAGLATILRSCNRNICALIQFLMDCLCAAADHGKAADGRLHTVHRARGSTKHPIYCCSARSRSLQNRPCSASQQLDHNLAWLDQSVSLIDATLRTKRYHFR